MKGSLELCKDYKGRTNNCGCQEIKAKCAPCTTAESSSAAVSSDAQEETPLSVAVVAAEAEAAGSALARTKASPLAHSRMTPSGDPVSVYLLCDTVMIN